MDYTGGMYYKNIDIIKIYRNERGRQEKYGITV